MKRLEATQRDIQCIYIYIHTHPSEGLVFILFGEHSLHFGPIHLSKENLPDKGPTDSKKEQQNRIVCKSKWLYNLMDLFPQQLPPEPSPSAPRQTAPHQGSFATECRCSPSAPPTTRAVAAAGPGEALNTGRMLHGRMWKARCKMCKGSMARFAMSRKIVLKLGRFGG